MGRAILLSCLCLMGLSACATTGSQRVYRDATSLERLQEALDEGALALNETLSAMTTLAVADSDTSSSAGEAFLKALSGLEKRAARVRERADEVERSVEREFRRWETEMAATRGAQIEGMSEGRRATVNARFEEIQNGLVATREAFDPLMEEYRSVREAIRDPDGTAVVVKETIDERFSEITRLSAEVSARLAETMNAIFEAERLWTGR